MKMTFFACTALFCWAVPLFSQPQYARITTTMADVRAAPKIEDKTPKPPVLFMESNRYTQVLFGSLVQVEPSQENDWLKVRIPFQWFSEGNNVYERNVRWSTISGYMQKNQTELINDQNIDWQNNLVVKSFWGALYSRPDITAEKKDVSMGSCFYGIPVPGSNYWHVGIKTSEHTMHPLGFMKDTDLEFIGAKQPLDPEILRKKFVSATMLFLDHHVQYVWGGVSAQTPTGLIGSQCTGPDCSGLTYLAALVCGLYIPRNSGSQYAFCEPIERGADLEYGDLVFLYQENALTMRHVMVYVGDDMLAETSGVPFLHGGVCLSAQKSFGKSLKDLVSHDIIDRWWPLQEGDTHTLRYGICFGSLFKNKEKLARMRKAVQSPLQSHELFSDTAQ
ncbi:MAG: Cell wall-associated hydrolase, invasion-associated protein [candidate division TM6 bacterium GW2011_GWE2_41_16]|nr:MAG: Cell wall-associated hydrolase, invasion-associated protein [candidate division TM6 bacterium GW2011_GWE2_41_16]